jgi:hypothetical protein
MKDFAFDPITHDRYLVNGDSPFLEKGAETMQNVKIRLLTIQGEIQSNFTKGLPWVSDMFDPTISNQKKKSWIRKVIIGTPGVDSIVYSNFMNEDKVSYVDYIAETIYGVRAEGQVKIDEL